MTNLLRKVQAGAYETTDKRWRVERIEGMYVHPWQVRLNDEAVARTRTLDIADAWIENATAAGESPGASAGDVVVSMDGAVLDMKIRAAKLSTETEDTTMASTGKLSKKLAKELDKEIRATADAMQDAHDEFMLLRDQLSESIAKARSFDHAYLDALGFSSWPAYLVDAVGVNVSNVAERRECAAMLLSHGMSYRAIGEVLGVSKDTVQRDMLMLDDDQLSRPETVESLDGRKRPSKTARKSAALTPKQRYTRVYNRLSEAKAVMVDSIMNDDEFAGVAREELDHLAEFHKELGEIISRLRHPTSRAKVDPNSSALRAAV